MAINYGELEKYLGQQYANSLMETGVTIYEESTELVDGSLKAMELYNKQNLFLNNRRQSLV